MEAYVKLRKSVAGKSKGKKSSSSIKSPSAPGPSTPNVDFDDHILAHFSVFSQDVDNRIAFMSSSIMNRLNELPVFVNIEDRFANRSLGCWYLRRLLAILRPCVTLSAPMSFPFGFRVVQVD